MSRPDQCPKCGSLSYDALHKDGTIYNPFTETGLWDKCRCRECGEVWLFRIVHFVAQEAK